MKRLAKFTFESETTIRLHFEDNSQALVTIDQLANHLEGSDLIKVQRALNLRRQFIRRILPPWALGLGGLAVAAMLITATTRTAGWYRLVPLRQPQQLVEATAPVTPAKLDLRPQTASPPPAPASEQQQDAKTVDTSTNQESTKPDQPKSQDKSKDDKRHSDSRSDHSDQGKRAEDD